MFFPLPTRTPCRSSRRSKCAGAREHNLKSIDVDIPARPARRIYRASGGGSGASPRWAFDTIYPEGQRRYVESLSAYARQFLGHDGISHDVDHISGPLPGDLHRAEDHAPEEPALDRVGTVTEIYGLHAASLRPRQVTALFARHPASPSGGPAGAGHGRPGHGDGGRARAAMLPSPRSVRDRKGEYPQGRFLELRKQGFQRGRSTGKFHELRRPAHARQEVPPRHRRRGRPDRGARGARDAARRQFPHRARSRRRHRDSRNRPPGRGGGRRGRGARGASPSPRTSPGRSRASPFPRSSRACSRFNRPLRGLPRLRRSRGSSCSSTSG